MNESVVKLNRTREVAVEEPKIKTKIIDVEAEIAKCPLDLYGSRLLVIEEEIIEYSGIFIPEHAYKDGQMRTNRGIIVAVGPDCTFTSIKDRVLYARYSGSWVLDKYYRIMNEEDVLGIVKEGANLDFVSTGADVVREGK